MTIRAAIAFVFAGLASAYAGCARDTAGKVSIAISVSGAGKGLVASVPAGIACGNDCESTFPVGSRIRLEAVPVDDSSVFGGWSGACATATAQTCELELVSDLTVGASFGVRILSVEVGVNPAGAGLIRTRDGSRFCAGTCIWDVAHGTALELVREAGEPFRAAEWLGACASATDVCSVTVTDGLRLGSLFVARPRIDVRLEGASGVGRIGVAGRGQACDANCTFWADPGDEVSLTAEGGTHQDVFRGWDSPCGTEANCVFTVEGDSTWTARFSSVHVWSRGVGARPSIAAGQDGTVWAVGDSKDPIDLGGGTISPPTFGTAAAFAARYLPSGAHSWSRVYGTTGETRASSITVTPTGTAFVGGAFRDSTTLGQFNLTSAGGYDSLLFALTPTGDVDRVAQFGDSSDDPFLSLAGGPMQMLAAIGVSGSKTSLSQFDPVSLQPSWAHPYPVSRDVVVSPTGAVTTAVVPSGTPLDVGCSNLLPIDVLSIASFNPDGSCRWTYAPTQGAWGIEGLAAAPDGRIVIVGTFDGQLTFGGATLGSADSKKQGFVAVLSDTGVAQWIRQLWHDGLIYSGVTPRAAAVSDIGTVLIVGSFRYTADLGAGAIFSKNPAAFWLSLSMVDGRHLKSQSFPSDSSTSSLYEAVALPSGRFAVAATFTGTLNLGGAVLQSNGASSYAIGALHP